MHSTGIIFCERCTCTHLVQLLDRNRPAGHVLVQLRHTRVSLVVLPVHSTVWSRYCFAGHSVLHARQPSS